MENEKAVRDLEARLAAVKRMAMQNDSVYLGNPAGRYTPKQTIEVQSYKTVTKERVTDVGGEKTKIHEEMVVPKTYLASKSNVYQNIQAPEIKPERISESPIIDQIDTETARVHLQIAKRGEKTYLIAKSNRTSKYFVKDITEMGLPEDVLKRDEENIIRTAKEIYCQTHGIPAYPVQFSQYEMRYAWDKPSVRIEDNQVVLSLGVLNKEQYSMNQKADEILQNLIETRTWEATRHRKKEVQKQDGITELEELAETA